jgi:hypothetical protein
MSVFGSRSIVPGLRSLFTIAVVTGCAAGNAVAQDCALKRMASLPMLHSSDGGIAVMVTVDGEARKFTVDPDSTYSGIYEDVAKEMNLRIEHLDSSQVYKDNGKQIGHYALIPTFTIGATTATNVHFLSSSRTNTVTDIAGFIGTDVLKNFDLDFDFAGMTLNLFSQEHCKGKVVYWAPDYVDIPYKASWGGRLQIPVTLDGHDLDAVLSTENDDTYLDAKSADEIYGVDDHSNGSVPLKSAKPNDLARFAYRFKSLSMSGVSVSNPLISLLHSNAEAAFERDEGKAASSIIGDRLNVVPLSIGLNVLAKLHLYIAYGEHEIYLTGANAGKTSPPAPASH